MNKQDTVIASVSSCVTKFCCNLSKAYHERWFLCGGTSLLFHWRQQIEMVLASGSDSNLTSEPQTGPVGTMRYRLPLWGQLKNVKQV